MPTAAIKKALIPVSNTTNRGKAIKTVALAVEHGVGAVPPQVTAADLAASLAPLTQSSEREDIVLRAIGNVAVTRNGAAETELATPNINIIPVGVLKDLALHAATVTP